MSEISRFVRKILQAPIPTIVDVTILGRTTTIDARRGGQRSMRFHIGSHYFSVYDDCDHPAGGRATILREEPGYLPAPQEVTVGNPAKVTYPDSGIHADVVYRNH